MCSSIFPLKEQRRHTSDRLNKVEEIGDKILNTVVSAAAWTLTSGWWSPVIFHKMSWLFTCEWVRDECGSGRRWFITQETWWTCSQAQHCCPEASGNRGLPSELERVPAVRIQARLWSRPLTLVRGMCPVSARTPCLPCKKAMRGPQYS